MKRDEELLGISFNPVIATRYIQVLLGQLDTLHFLGDFWQFNIETMKVTVYSWILKVWGQQLTTLKTILTVDWREEEKNF